MTYELMTEADYETLPAEPQQKFVALEQICRTRMMELITASTPQDFDALLRTQYMTMVSEAASELGVEGVFFVDLTADTTQNLNEFMRRTSGAVTRIRLRKSSSRDPQSVRLASKAKGIIEHEIAKLRASVAESELTDNKKQRLLDKIEEFRTELHKERLSISAAMSTLVIICAALGATTEFLANAPNAVTTIMHLIGTEKELEEQELLRLEGPKSQGQKLLPSQAGGPATQASPKTSRHFDEEIPF